MTSENQLSFKINTDQFMAQTEKKSNFIIIPYSYLYLEPEDMNLKQKCSIINNNRNVSFHHSNHSLRFSKRNQSESSTLESLSRNTEL